MNEPGRNTGPPRPVDMPALWQSAASFAARAHASQIRKDGRTPYAAHPTRVALTVACLFDCTDPTILAAALLHDTIEDCNVVYDDILEAFGPEVADLVAALTKDTRLIEAEREAAYTAQLAAAPWAARLIKLADVYDNLADTNDRSSKRKAIRKARVALSLAANDSRLDHARKVLADAVESVEKMLERDASAERATKSD